MESVVENNSSNQDHHQLHQHEQKKKQLLSGKRPVIDSFNKAKVSTVFVLTDTPDTSLVDVLWCNTVHRFHLYWWPHIRITTWIKHCDFGYGSCGHILVLEKKKEVLVHQMASSLTTDSNFAPFAAAIFGRLMQQSRT
uniref:Uncharacterized protein n=1 Tax=Brassica oleracea TaxID=3712 RepID=A0A3P6FHG5_BRAOL|nr:unnamed protein product [Brassica oleracea]